MGTQTKIADQMIEQEGDYALALKGKQSNLYEEVQATFALAEKDGWRDLAEPSVRLVEKSHGRLQTREYWTLSDPALVTYLNSEQQWKGLRGLGMVRSQRQSGEEVSQETRYFPLTFPCVKMLARAVRGHRQSENSLHWVLDVAFWGDESRVRLGHADENVAENRHISLNLLRQEKSSRVGIHAKRLKAGWDNDYLLCLLAQVI